MKISCRMRSNSAGRRIVFCLVLMLLLMSQTAFAVDEQETAVTVDPVGSSENYSAILYDSTNGLPTDAVNDIAQTSDGFMWIGGYSGLVRYDGYTFERMDSTSGIASISCLEVDLSDRLWIGTNDFGVAVLEKGEYRLWDKESGLGTDKVTDVETASDGSVYVGTTSGITMFDQDFNAVRLDDPRIMDAYVDRISAGNDGLMYCVTNNGSVFTLQNGQLQDYMDRNDLEIKNITRVYPDPDAPGKVYIGTEDNGLYYGGLTDGPEKSEHTDTAPLRSVLEIGKFGDNLWICARNGIGVVDSEGFHYIENLPLNNSIYSSLMDYEGNLWFSSSRQGIMKLVMNRFTDISRKYDLPNNVINTTCIYDGKLFIGSDTDLTVVDKNGALESFPLKSVKTASGKEVKEDDLLKMLKGSRIRSLIEDSRGNLWICIWRTWGLLCYKDGNVTQYSEDDGLISDHIRAAYEAPDGSILVAGTGGMSVIQDGKVTASYSKKNGVANPESLTVCSAPNGDMLLGSNGGGISVINGDGIRCITKKDGLASDIVMRIKYDDKRNLFWIVAGNSIAYMTEDYKVTTIRRFPYPDNFDMYENSLGDMWIISSDGIYVVPADDLVSNNAFTPVHYGIANGMPCVATSNSYSELTAGGDLYIPGRTGVVKVNIESSMEDIGNIKMSVPFVDADGKYIYPDNSGRFTIPADVKKLTIHGRVFNFNLTDPEVSYRLIGMDREKTTVRTSNLAPVAYTNLNGGNYRFVMELKDAMGRGNKNISVPITKTKALYEQTGFFLVMGALTAALLYYVIRKYVRRKISALEVKHQEEVEKERVARELQMANQIQNGMLPHDFPPFPGRTEFDVYAVMNPARQVGGDFYDFFFLDKNHLCLVIADVSGKGIPAAMFMMNCKVTLQSIAASGRSAAEILTRANNAVCANNNMEMFVTVWLGILNVDTGKLDAANAGHEYPVIKRAGGDFELIKDKHGLVIGAMEGVQYTGYELQLEAGDTLFVYTDGVPEATDQDNNMFGTERMLSALNAEPDASPQQLLTNVETAVADFVKDAEQFDDLTMLSLEYKG